MEKDNCIQLSDSVLVIQGPTNIGIIKSDDGVYLVDSGNDKEAGRKILKLLNEREWKLKGIINTHSHADHIGGNAYLQEKTGCAVLASKGERGFIESPVLEPSFLWGAAPYKDIRTKFFEAKPSTVTQLLGPGESFENFTVIPLGGHFFDCIGILTSDGVFFLGDSIFGSETISKHKIPYIYDIAEFRKSLERIRQTPAVQYVPSHGPVGKECGDLIQANFEAAFSIEKNLLEILGSGKTFENILKETADIFSIELGAASYMLIGSTVRAFLSLFYNDGRAFFRFEENKMIWKRTE
ncbi:MBL fold metallo-hydrolase [Brucepastera parasyntrophica]|uniref:MBL fold metallo-hydrolase n=1 Tax=Brucepastera parasyntrophica TaxID=2880008 RepID=UPI00210D2CB6|nr:MBL fold metallo-hydrolase [Brucepastera parasyntrophica]ULQ58587.1 MBL fold metallo-hydrolase [Brucepastera parasyntrophica]